MILGEWMKGANVKIREILEATIIIPERRDITWTRKVHSRRKQHLEGRIQGNYGEQKEEKIIHLIPPKTAHIIPIRYMYMYLCMHMYLYIVISIFVLIAYTFFVS